MKLIKSVALAAVRACVAPFGYEVLRLHRLERPWLEDATFMHLFEVIKPRTVVEVDRLFMLYQFAHHASTMPGDIAEVGVYKGGTARLFAECTIDSNKRIHLFDTFDGMPSQETFTAFGQKRELFTDTGLDAVVDFVGHRERVFSHKGIFPHTAADLQDRQFSLVHLDADLYESTKSGLEFFWPRMVPGGVIVLDDYGSQHWYGVKRAVEEFAQEFNVAPINTTLFQCVCIKK